MFNSRYWISIQRFTKKSDRTSSSHFVFAQLLFLFSFLYIYMLQFLSCQLKINSKIHSFNIVICNDESISYSLSLVAVILIEYTLYNSNIALPTVFVKIKNINQMKLQSKTKNKLLRIKKLLWINIFMNNNFHFKVYSYSNIIILLNSLFHLQMFVHLIIVSINRSEKCLFWPFFEIHDWFSFIMEIYLKLFILLFHFVR